MTNSEDHKSLPSLGATAKAAPVFAYVLRWDYQGRKGQRCAMITRGAFRCCMEFEDGQRAVISRNAFVRTPEFKMSSPNGRKGGRGSCQSTGQGDDVSSPTPHTTVKTRCPASSPTAASVLSNSQREAAYEGNQ